MCYYKGAGGDVSKGRWKSGPGREWELYGLSYNTWRYRKAHGIPLRKPEKGGRFSGLSYEVGADRIEELRSRYRNGVPAGAVEAMVDEWMGQEK